MKLIALICMLVMAAFVVSSASQEPTDVTLVRLIANPEKFDGKLIRVIGFLRLEFEGDVLYLHREDYGCSIIGDGIWVETSTEIMKQKNVLNMHYVLLEGVFSSSEKGHMGMWSGAIMKIRRAEVWKSLRQPN